MLKSKALTLQVAGAAALAMLFGTSVFAESRHLNGTRGGGGGSSHSSSGRSFGDRSFGGRSFGDRSFGGRSFGQAPRFESRNFSGRSGGSRGFSGPRSGGSRDFSGPRSGGSRGFSGPRSGGSRGVPRSVAPAWRGGSYGRSYGGRNAPFRGYNSGSRFYGRGRIDRIVPWNGGYRIWLGGWGYPFFVPYSFWDPFRFRIGLFCGFNAFYDPLGYYSVYDPYYYSYPPPAVVVAPPPVYRDGDYRDDGYGASVVRGTVQSVDLPRDTMWVNDEATHKVITVLMPPDRQLNSVRAGDYVEVSGDWKDDGVFDAHALDRYEPRR